MILLNSLNGLTDKDSNVKILSHTDKIYYFVVNYSRRILEGLVSQAQGSSEEETNEKLTVIKELMYQGGASDKIINFETLQQYTKVEIDLIEENKALVSLKK